MLKNLCLAGLFFCFLLLFGCSSHKVVHYDFSYVTTDSVPVSHIDTRSQERLAYAADSVSRSLYELSAIQQAKNPAVKTSIPYDIKDPQLARHISVRWIGPVQSLVKKMADTLHYRLRVLGNPPAIAVLIQLNEVDQPMLEVFRNINYQIVKKARVTVYSKTRTIELRYYPI